MLLAGTMQATLPSIEILLQIIINNFLANSYCITFVSEEDINFQIPFSFTYIATNGTDLDELANKILDVSEKGCSDYIVRVKEPSIFMEAFEKVNYMGNARRSNRKIIMLPFNESDEDTKVLLDILLMKETSSIANILLIVPAITKTPGCTSYDLVTHKFVGRDDEVSMREYLDKWDSCTKEFERGANLFPNDISNLQGKIVKVGCFTYKPYVILDVDSPTGRDGTEVRIVEEFCRWVNCTIEIVREDEDQWGEMYENRTGIGVLGSVIEDRADLGITALYSWYEIYLYLDFSAASIRTAITCIAPAPRLLVSWEMPLLPFSWNMWIGTVLTFIISSLALILAMDCSSNKAFLTIFGMMTAQSQDDASGSWKIRSVTGWLLVASLILCSAYGAGLASTFTVPKFENSVDTVQDITDRKLQWGATHDAWIYSLTLSPEPLIKQLVSQFKIYSAEELKRRSFTRSMAFSIEKLPAGNFAIGGYITKEAVPNLMIMRENFYYEQNVVMARKSSPYTAKVSDLIGRLHETGLMLAWETQVALKYLDYKVQIEVKLSRSLQKAVKIEPLSFRHIVGIFYIYIVGIAISLLLFVVELCAKRERNELKPSSPIHLPM
ncbi:ionotropic receptor 21a-like [Pectinophora gossypiella]|uniref:ionotropic receptor 21a-like n=1 Tax=Pectinophora gossypiella TaxID=13191 RepID=UPI00214F1380|nr:ionotropic receptor 21a-like [Pectinophora gossypiella]